MILVAGASGTVGGEVCRLLRGRGEPVRGLVRPTSQAEKVAELERLGVEVVRGDVRDPASLAAACSGVRAVVSTVATYASQDPANSLSSVEAGGQINLIDAASAAGVEHFIPSTYGLDPRRVEKECPLVDAKTAAEQHLIRSGMSYTIIYSGFFMEAWLSPAFGFDAANARARIYGGGRNALSWISFRDVAQAIATCLVDGRFRDRVLELGGPEVMTPLDVVRIFEAEGGRAFELEFVPEEVLLGMEQTTDPMQKTIAVFAQIYARGHVLDAGGHGLDLRWVTVRDYARGVLAPAAAPAPAV